MFASGNGYNYRHTVAIWFRGVFALQDHAQLMAGAPLVYQIHTLSAWAILALWPFSRLLPPGASRSSTSAGRTSSTAAATRPPADAPPAGKGPARTGPGAIPPASGAVVMGTGIVSIALSLDRQETLSRILLAFAAVAWLALGLLLAGRALRDRQRVHREARSPAALAGVAGTAVLGTRLTLLGWDSAAIALLVIAAAFWLVCSHPCSPIGSPRPSACHSY